MECLDKSGVYCRAYLLDAPYHIDRPFDYTATSAEPGDIVRYVMYYDNPETENNEYTEHSIFVLDVEGDNVKYVDCNGHGGTERCIIEWDKTITKTKLQNKGLVHIRIAPYKVR